MIAGLRLLRGGPWSAASRRESRGIIAPHQAWHAAIYLSRKIIGRYMGYLSRRLRRDRRGGTQRHARKPADTEDGMRNSATRRAGIAEAPAAYETDRVGAGMQRWRREFPDIDCSGKAVVGRLLHLHEVILKAVNATLAKHRLKYPAYAVLATLRVEGKPYRMSPKALLDTLILTSGGLS